MFLSINIILSNVKLINKEKKLFYNIKKRYLTKYITFKHILFIQNVSVSCYFIRENDIVALQNISHLFIQSFILFSCLLKEQSM